jgi:hypothetical protein
MKTLSEKASAKWKTILFAAFTCMCLVVTACWHPGSSEGDYAVTWGAATVTVNDMVFDYSVEDAGYVGVIEGEIEGEPNNFKVILDFADPEALRPTECDFDLDNREARICLCERNEAEELKGFCESLLIEPPIWNITAGDTFPGGASAEATLKVLPDEGLPVYAKVTTAVEDILEGEKVLLIFSDLGISLGGAYGFWSVGVAAQQRNLILERDAGTDKWATSLSDPSSYEGHVIIGVGFTYWSLIGLNMHYSRPVMLNQL